MAAREHSLPSVPGRIAILHTAGDRFAASDTPSIQDAMRAMRRAGLDPQIVSRSDLGALDEFAGLFIRDLTAPTNHTMQAARRMEHLRRPSLDSSSSIEWCSNKIAIDQLLATGNVPQPRSMIVTPLCTAEDIVARLGTPVVLKIPHGSFSLGVSRAHDLAEIRRELGRLRAQSLYLLAQEYVPSAFDWRIGVLEGEPLFGCRYHMARGHWQIINHKGPDHYETGEAEAVALSEVPERVLDAALHASRLVGRGLYGVDIKEVETGAVVIEVNANPDLYSEFEASIDPDRVWQEIAAWFSRRLDLFCEPPRHAEAA